MERYVSVASPLKKLAPNQQPMPIAFRGNHNRAQSAVVSRSNRKRDDETSQTRKNIINAAANGMQDLMNVPSMQNIELVASPTFAQQTHEG